MTTPTRRLPPGPQAVIDSLRRDDLPITRENYIGRAWGKFPPDEEWTAEHEAELPEELQDR